MSLPPFGQNDLLPDGVHSADPSEFEIRCVTEFPTSSTRPRIFQGFCRYQNAISSVGLHATQRVDGSFTDRSRINPEDVDVANFLDAVELNQLGGGLQVQAGRLLSGGEETKKIFHAHTFLVIKFLPGHPLEKTFESQRRYWRKWFATPQDYSGPGKIPAPRRGRKGIVQMYAGDAILCPTVDPH